MKINEKFRQSFIDKPEFWVKEKMTSFRFSKTEGLKGTFDRQIISRIIAVALPFFSGAMIGLKLVSGLLDVSVGLQKSIKEKRWNKETFSKEYAAVYFSSLGKSIAISTLGFAGVINPDCSLRLLNIETKQNYPTPTENPNQKKSFTIRNSVSPAPIFPVKSSEIPFIDHRSIALNQLKTLDSEVLKKDWRIADFVGQTTYINLDRVVERREKLEKHLLEIGFKEGEFSRLVAVDGQKELPNEIAGLKIPKDLYLKMKNNLIRANPATEKGRLALKKLNQNQTACALSHFTALYAQLKGYEAAEKELLSLLEEIKTASDEQKPEYQAKIKDCKQRLLKFSRQLIIEDDNRFGRKQHKYRFFGNKPDEDSFNTDVGDVFRLAMVDLPDDFDLFFFSALNLTKVKYQPGKRCQPIEACYDLNAYVVNVKACRPLLDRLERAITDPNEILEPIDVLFADMMRKNEVKAFIATPPLAMQDRRMVSAITSTKEGLVQYGNHLWKRFDADPLAYSYPGSPSQPPRNEHQNKSYLHGLKSLFQPKTAKPAA